MCINRSAENLGEVPALAQGLHGTRVSEKAARNITRASLKEPRQLRGTLLTKSKHRRGEQTVPTCPNPCRGSDSTENLNFQVLVPALPEGRCEGFASAMLGMFVMLYRRIQFHTNSNMFSLGLAQAGFVQNRLLFPRTEGRGHIPWLTVRW